MYGCARLNYTNGSMVEIMRANVDFLHFSSKLIFTSQTKYVILFARTDLPQYVNCKENTHNSSGFAISFE